MRAQHSHDTDQHGTPPEFVEIARHALGSFDLDPTSSHVFNRWIDASRYLTEQDDATKTPWFAGGPHPLRVMGRAPDTHRPETVFCNPPGSDDGCLVKALWYSLCSYWFTGWISSAVWVGFSVEQKTYLQRTRAPFHPLQLMTLDPSRRYPYRTPAGTLAPSPPHASYLTLLSMNAAVRRRFIEAASPLGYVSHTR